MDKIGIIGAGHIGATTARLFLDAGHDVALSNSRGPETLAGLVQQLGPRAHAMTPEAAARWADVILLAVPWRAPEALPPVDAVAGKIVIDAMNPYGKAGGVEDLGASTSSEETGKRLPGARLVKAFNTIWFKHLAERCGRGLSLIRGSSVHFGRRLMFPIVLARMCGTICRGELGGQRRVIRLHSL